MNNDGKKTTGGIVEWWKSISTAVKAAVIAGAACVIIVPVVLILLLGGDTAGGGGGANRKPGGGSTGTTTYSITVKTNGGMAMEGLPIYIYDYVDGELGEDIVDIASTDENGKATFKLSKNGEYAARISTVKGYDFKPYYPIISTDMSLTVSSKLISDTNLAGVSYKLGDVMRDFTITTTTGEQFTLSEIFEEKKAVLINFWFSTCGPCQSEFPLMVKAYEDYKEDLAVIAINPLDSLLDIQSYQSNNGLTFDVAEDTIGLKDAFGVEDYPTSIMIDRYGVITFVEVGSITSQRVFDSLFSHFTAENYEQKLVREYEDIVPKEKPDVEMPSGEALGAVLDKGNIEGIKYSPYSPTDSDETKEYSWPFIIDEAKGCIKTSNANKEASFAQLIIEVPLKAGDVLAFDWFSSTELGADIMYVVVDGKDIYSISGISEEWKTCYAYVAEEDATYTVGLVYQKDSSDNVGDDTVCIRNLRVVGVSNINSPTYIYRFAATKRNSHGKYEEYVDVFLGQDGYYHVDSATGPLLLANLLGYTRFSDDNTAYFMCIDKPYEAVLTRYSNYASNSAIYGVTPVTKELYDALLLLAKDYGDINNPNEWLKLCCYYDSYGTGGKQLEDPIKGLATFSAYEAKLSNKGSSEFPNSLTYDRVIMPKGLLTKFTPVESGTYLITSSAPKLDSNGNPDGFYHTNGWIFTADSFDQRVAWYTYENVDRFNLGLQSDQDNCYMMVYLEKDKDYYIDIAFDDVYQEGTIKFRIERLGGEGAYRFTLASPGYFTTAETQTGEMSGQIIHGGIDVVLGDDGIWREKRTDGRTGSIIYADFTRITPIFTQNTLEQMIDKGAFNFTKDEDGNPVSGGEDLTELARSFLSQKITVGYNATLGETISEGDARIGCIIVTEELSDLLQKLMDKYTFMNGTAPNLTSIENSWLKLCYYHHYFCAATPK